MMHAKLMRRDEKINEQLVPLFDPSGRLFVASEDPRPADVQSNRLQERQDLSLGVITINEVRQGRGMDPVPWGNQPFKQVAPQARRSPTPFSREPLPGETQR
jgi:hypothetical protein